MNVKRQIFLDRYAIRIFISLINIWVRILGFILRIDHSLDKSFKKIAVCKYKGLGSIIQATPLLRNLRLKYPNAKIVFVRCFVLTKTNITVNTHHTLFGICI